MQKKTECVSCLQPKGKKAKGKKVAPAPAVVKKQEAKKVVNPLFEKRPKNFGIGEYVDVWDIFSIFFSCSMNRCLNYKNITAAEWRG